MGKYFVDLRGIFDLCPTKDDFGHGLIDNECGIAKETAITFQGAAACTRPSSHRKVNSGNLRSTGSISLANH